MTAYYNEIDSGAADWLENLIAGGELPAGIVDRRSITDVRPSDLAGFDQCHFFAGIGGWPLALRLAGWPDSRPVWTGSCPCQPFSAAGKGEGFDDPRHLWPEFFRLISDCRPDVVLGEQVASKDGLAWLDALHADLEGADYAVGAVDTCAAGIGAPHIRQRLYWLAYAPGAGSQGIALGGAARPGREGASLERVGSACRLADASGARVRDNRPAEDARTPSRAEGPRAKRERIRPHARDDGRGRVDGLADPAERDKQRHAGDTRGTASARGGEAWPPHGHSHRSAGGVVRGQPGPTNGFWRNADWLLCRDGKWRPVESGTFPLAHGVPGRVVKLRAYGNAIVIPQAVAFVEAVQDTLYPAIDARAGDLDLRMIEAFG